MEKEIIWASVAQNDLWQIAEYLKAEWPEKVLTQFQKALVLKTTLLKKQPLLGFKSHKYSRFRKTLVTRHYMLIYSVSKEHLIIHRIKHTRMG